MGVPEVPQLSAGNGELHVVELGKQAGQVAIFLYDLASQDWWFTTESLYPNLFSFARDRWIFYFAEGDTPRELADLETGEFFSIP